MSDNRYIVDEKEKESAGLISFDNVIKAGVVVAGVTTLHKSGALNGVINKTAKKLSSLGRNNKVSAFHEARAFIESSEESVADSLFRSSMSNTIAKIKDEKSLKKVFDETLDDIKEVSKILKGESEAGLDKLFVLNESSKRNHFELVDKLDEGWQAIKEMAERGDTASLNGAKSLIHKSIARDFVEDLDTGLSSLEKNGLRTATISDLFTVNKSDNGIISLVDKGHIRQFSPDQFGKKSPTTEKIENFLNSKMTNIKGQEEMGEYTQKRLHDMFNFKSFKVDSNIKIGSEGDLIDLRDAQDNLTNSVRALANEVKVPVLGLNPFKMAGFDKFRKNKTTFGFVDGDSVSPALTLLRGNGIDHTINAVKDGHEFLDGVKNGVLLVDGNVYKHAMDGEGLEKIAYKSKKNITRSYARGDKGFTDINQLEYSMLKMQGITNVKSLGDPEDNGGVVRNFLSKFDIGMQEKQMKKMDLEPSVLYDPDRAFSYVASKFLGKGQHNLEYFDDARAILFKGDYKLKTGPINIITNKGKGINDIRSGSVLEDAGSMVSELFADFNHNPESVTKKTALGHFLTDRLSSSLGSVGLALSEEGNSGGVKRAGQMITKRFLPIFGAYAGWQALNAIGEGTDSNGQRTNLNRTVMELYANIDVGLSELKDSLGITKMAKKIGQLTPGNDFIGELPLNPFRNVDQSSEERSHYWEHGKDKVRKGRYWGLSTSTAFTGSTVDYFRANKLQQAKGDAMFSDSKYGSRGEFFKSLFNPYHYDLKHYKDRPYLMTAPAFENVPVFGEVMSGTIGKVIKPQLKMHHAYWGNDGPLKTHELKTLQVREQIENVRSVSADVSNVLREEAGLVVEEIMKPETNFINKVLDKAGSHFESVANKINETGRKMARDFRYNRWGVPEGAQASWFGNNSMEQALIAELEPHTRRIDGLAFDKAMENAYFAMGIRKAQEGYDNADNKFARNLADKMVQVGGDVIDTTIKKPFFDSPYYASRLGAHEATSYTKLNDRDISFIHEDPFATGRALGKDADFSKIMSFDNEHNLAGQFVVYRTGGSGKLSIEATGKEQDPFIAVNVRKESVDSFSHGKFNTNFLTEGLVDSEDIRRYKENGLITPNGFEHTWRTQVNDFMNVAGIYGYGGSTMLVGDTMANKTVLETSGHAMGFNKIFWDQDLGGFTGDISEIFRRLVQNRKQYGVEYFNPIRNTMPDWLPGEGSFIDFQHGDPYSKIKNGEERLVGEGYERMYGIDIDDYKMTSSKLGGDVHSMVKTLLKRDGINDEHSLSIVKKGTALHLRAEEYMHKHQLVIDTEQEVWDRKNNLSGIYDARIYDTTARSGQAIVDVKSINQKGFDKVVSTNKAKEEHMKQVNFSIHNTNKNHGGGVLYVNRDSPEQMHLVKFQYSKEMYNETVNNVQEARRQVKDAINTGQISRAERYRPIDKFRILADVAPHSDEFGDMKKYLSSLSLSGRDKDEFDRINDRVSEQKKQTRTHGYKFKDNEVKTMRVQGHKDMGRYTYSLKGSDTPIKFAGIDIKTTAQLQREGLTQKEAEIKSAEIKAYLAGVMKGNLKIKVADDKYRRINKDTASTMDAVVYSRGKNINKKLIKMGYATENEEDFSAPAIATRFNGLQRLVGRSWETVAHQNTIFNNKILRVRSAKEDYERSQVYNIDFKQWTKPIDHFVKPLVWQGARKESVSSRVMASASLAIVGALVGRGLPSKTIHTGLSSASKMDLSKITISGSVIGASIGATGGGIVGGSVLMGGMIGSAFGGVGAKGRVGRVIGATAGVATVIAAKAHRRHYEKRTGKTWTPQIKRDQNEVVDYLDKIKYVKNRRLFETYAKRALEYDGIDVKRELNDSREKAGRKKAFATKIDKRKQQQRRDGYFDITEFVKRDNLRIDKDLLKGVRHFREHVEKDYSSTYSSREVRSKRFAEMAYEFSKDDRGRVNKEMLKYIAYGDKEAQKDRLENKEKIKKYKKRVKEADTKAYQTKRNLQMKAVNDAINNKPNSAMATSYNAMKAIEFYNQSESSLYAYDPGDSMMDFVSALPEKDRKYFNEFLEAGEKERKKIVDMAPSYMRRALQGAYGMQVDEKEDLTEYFTKHALPDAGWDGWQEDMDFNAIKTKVISKAGFALADHGIWEDDIIKADGYGSVPLPNINHKTSDYATVSSELKEILGNAGYYDVDVDVMSSRSSNLNIQVIEDSRNMYRQRIRGRMEEM